MTADHGCNMRFYPVFVVKEAHRSQNGFAVDSSPLSLLEDYEDIIVQLTSGKSFSTIVAGMELDDGRVRKALDFRAEAYAKKTIRKTTVSIKGLASREDSYYYERDEFLLDDNLIGSYHSGEPILEKGAPASSSAKVYGLDDDGKVFGHSVVMDIAFDSAESRTMTLHMRLHNPTDSKQTVKTLWGEEVLSVGAVEAQESKEIEVHIPQKGGDRWTLEINVPDAKKRLQEEDTLGWTKYESIVIDDAKLVED